DHCRSEREFPGLSRAAPLATSARCPEPRSARSRPGPRAAPGCPATPWISGERSVPGVRKEKGPRRGDPGRSRRWRSRGSRATRRAAAHAAPGTTAGPSTLRPVLERRADVLHDLVARDVRLRVALELFYLDHAAIELRVTEHEANRRTEVARAP